MDFGFLPLSRKFFESDLWSEPRIFSRAEAWIDLIRTANFKPGTVIVDGRCISLQRGELVASLRYVSNRWRWPKSKAERFYALLKDCRRIETRTETGITVVKLCNYKQFNITPGQDWDSNRDEVGTLSGHSRDKTEQGNKVIRELGPPSAGEQEVEFPKGFPSTEADAITAASMVGVPPDFAARAWNECAARHGKDIYMTPVSRWANYVKARYSTEIGRVAERKSNSRNGQHRDTLPKQTEVLPYVEL
jgi:hypothetical protein